VSKFKGIRFGVIERREGGGMIGDPDERMSTCHHEAAHAVFAYHDGVEIDAVGVSDERGYCTILRADLYERYQPWEYVRFCLAGVYAAYVADTLEHPQPGEVSMPWLRGEARRVPQGDAWRAIETLEDYASTDGFPFGSIEEAYAALFEGLGALVEERWREIEAVAFSLFDKWSESEQGIGRTDGDELTLIIESTREGKDHAQQRQPHP
jgi:hypothetical protein